MMKTLKLKKTSESQGTKAVAPGERERRIREAAYYHAEQHAFDGGDPVADWLAAEAEVDALLASERKTVERKTVERKSAGTAMRNNGKSIAEVASSAERR